MFGGPTSSLARLAVQKCTGATLDQWEVPMSLSLIQIQPRTFQGEMDAAPSSASVEKQTAHVMPPKLFHKRPE